MRSILTRRPQLQLILMSATLDTERFASYFADISNSRGAAYKGGRCPMVDIPGFAHPVQDFYLEDAAALTNFTPRALRGAGGGDGEEEENRGAEVDRGQKERKGTEAGGANDVAAALDYRHIAGLVGTILDRQLHNDLSSPG